MEGLKKFLRKAVKIFKWILIISGIVAGALLVVGLLFPNKEILKDAFVAPDVSLKSTTIKYETKDKQKVSVPAYAGQVEILTSNGTDLEKVSKFISEHGGKIIAQAPAVGIYIAEVSAGKETELIEALLKEDWVVDVYPHILLEKNQAEYIFDFWKEPSRERSHGAAVCYYANGQHECAKEILDGCFADKTCQDAEWPIFYQVLREIKTGEDAPFITINLSLGPKTKNKNGEPLSTPTLQAMYRAYFSSLIQILSRDNLAGVKKTIIINSAGNDGADLTPVLEELSPRKGFLRLIVAGAVTPAGNISSYTNYSKKESDIIYSVGGEKSIPMAGSNLIWTGTSFAAPQIACLLDNWFNESPKRARNPKEFRDFVFDANAGKDTKRDFQYRYRIDPCLNKHEAEKPETEKPQEEPRTEKPVSQSIVAPSTPLLKSEPAIMAAPVNFRIDSFSCNRTSSSDYEISAGGFASGPNNSSLSFQILKKDPKVTGGYGTFTCSDWNSFGAKGCSRKSFFDNKDSTTWSYADFYTDTTSVSEERQNTFQIDLLFKMSAGSKVDSKEANVICRRETREEVLERWRNEEGLPAKPPALVFSIPERLPNAFVGKYYNHKFEASGGISPYNFQLKSDSAPPPPNISLFRDGVLLGKPGQKESKIFSVCARDSAFQEVCGNTILTVEDAPPEPPPPPPAPNCSEGKYNKCVCNDGRTYTCPQSDYYVVECLANNKAKCISSAPLPSAPPPAAPPSSIAGKWNGTYTTECFGGNWSADIADNGGNVSGNFTENKKFIVGPVSGTFRDGFADLKVSSGEYSATLKGTVSGNSFSGTLDSSCIQYVPGQGIRNVPSSGKFSGQKN